MINRPTRCGWRRIPISDSQLHTGRTKSSAYYWADPETDAALYHTSVGEEQVIPFFDSVERAEQYLEKRANTSDDNDRFENLSLYRATVRKELDAVEVLMEQAGIADFGGEY